MNQDKFNVHKLVIVEKGVHVNLNYLILVCSNYLLPEYLPLIHLDIFPPCLGFKYTVSYKRFPVTKTAITKELLVL